MKGGNSLAQGKPSLLGDKRGKVGRSGGNMNQEVSGCREIFKSVGAMGSKSCRVVCQRKEMEGGMGLLGVRK